MPDLKYFLGNPIPIYADFRHEVDKLYPDLAPYIAIRNIMPDGCPQYIEEDLHRQIAPEIIAKIPEATRELILSEFYRRWPVSKSGGLCMSFFDLADNEKFEVHYCYLALGDYAKDPRDNYASLSIMRDYDIGLGMQFNQAALDVPMLAWFQFYHELEHAVSALKQKEMISDYERFLRETRADVFAAIHLLYRFGARALPVIETIADMRLSNFYQCGPDHFTTPALRSTAAGYRAGRIVFSNGLRSSFNAAADGCARENFLHEADVNAYVAAEKACIPAVDRHFVFQRRESVMTAYCDRPPNGSMPWRARQNAWFDESETILEQRYFNFSRR